MDDLAGLDWNAPATNPPHNNNNNTHNNTTTPSYPPPLSSTPALQPSGRSTPLSSQASGTAFANLRAAKPVSKPTTPADDSFSGLLSLNYAAKTTNNLSLQERQKQLQEEKARQEAERRKQFDATFGAGDAQFWDNLGSNGRSTPQSSISPPPSQQQQQQPQASFPSGQSLSNTINKPFQSLHLSQSNKPSTPSNDDHDLLAAFDSAAPVDRSSHYPVPSSAASGRSTPAQLGGLGTPANDPYKGSLGDDDDPFGLNSLSQRTAAAPTQPTAPTADNDDDDILGDLGKPVSELPPPKPQQRAPTPAQDEEPVERQPRDDPRDKAVAELVDMGFPAAQAAEALAETGGSVQAAVSWLLNRAHEEARQKAHGSGGGRGRESPMERERERERPRREATRHEENVPAWMRGQERSRSGQRRQDNRSPAGEEKELSKVAQELGRDLFKSANSLWKQGRKQVQKAMAEFQESDPSQPKWMRNAHTGGHLDEPASARARKEPDVTDEAMMLESGGGRPPKPQRHAHREPALSPTNPFADRAQSERAARPARAPTGKLTREVVEQEAAQAYISPARRRKPGTASPAAAVAAEPAQQPKAAPARSPLASPPIQPSNGTSNRNSSNNPFLNQASAAKAPPPSKPTPRPTPTPAPPTRTVPPISPAALTQSTSHRDEGTAAFKRGDYAAAHAAYTAALAPLPDAHPLRALLLANRALTALKTGDAKAAVADADAALALIGPGRGEGETVEPGKGLREVWAKAMTRKAEGLEGLERWAEAAGVWRGCVEAGVGGAVAMRGRERCERAAASGGGGGAAGAATAAAAGAAAAPARATSTAGKPSAGSGTGKSKAVAEAGRRAEEAAVRKLRAANQAAEAQEDERFALTDAVDARIAAWRSSREGNLRALLGGLDAVLWEGSGWQRVGMADLVLPGRVKVAYMKAIARVHPDKLPPTATTEQRMVSAAVFATLNEAWDRFKSENGL